VLHSVVILKISGGFWFLVIITEKRGWVDVFDHIFWSGTVGGQLFYTD
jgi:hypothetical protein